MRQPILGGSLALGTPVYAQHMFFGISFFPLVFTFVSVAVSS